VNDMVALYEDNLEHYELEAHMGSAEAKEMLPKLQELLKTAQKEQDELRSSIQESIAHYEIELYKGYGYAAQILPKLYALVDDDSQSIASQLAA